MIYYENTKSCIVPGLPNGSREDVKNTKSLQTDKQILDI